MNPMYTLVNILFIMNALQPAAFVKEMTTY